MPKIRNKYSQKRNCMATVPSFHIHMSVSDLYIPTIDMPILNSVARKYVVRSWEYINHSQTHECGGTEAAHFPEKEHINGIFVAVHLCSGFLTFSDGSRSGFGSLDYGSGSGSTSFRQGIVSWPVFVFHVILRFQRCSALCPPCKEPMPKTRNKYSQKRNCVATVPVSTCICL